MERDPLRPLAWVASSKGDLKSFPAVVQDRMGYALYLAQTGRVHLDAKALKGFGPGVLEVISNHDGNAYRAVYTIRFAQAVYVLHAFKKKSKSGIATPKREIDLIRARLRIAEAHYAKKLGWEKRDATN